MFVERVEKMHAERREREWKVLGKSTEKKEEVEVEGKG